MKTKRHFEYDDDADVDIDDDPYDDEGTRNERTHCRRRRRRRFHDNDGGGGGVRDVAKQRGREISNVVWTMRPAGQRADEAGVVWDDATVRGLVRSRGVRGGLGDGCREVSDGVSRRAVREIPGWGDDGRVVRGVRRRSEDDASENWTKTNGGL